MVVVKRAERRITERREWMLDQMAEAGVSPASLEIIQRPVVSKGRIRGIWARFTGRDIELIARRVVK